MDPRKLSWPRGMVAMAVLMACPLIAAAQETPSEMPTGKIVDDPYDHRPLEEITPAERARVRIQGMINETRFKTEADFPLTKCFDSAIDFLDGNQIRFDAEHHPGNPFEIELAVHSLAMVDVVTQDTDSERLLCLSNGCG